MPRLIIVIGANPTSITRLRQTFIKNAVKEQRRKLIVWIRAAKRVAPR